MAFAPHNYRMIYHKLDFLLEIVQSTAVVVTEKRQTGLFFKKLVRAIKEYNHRKIVAP